jgi:hypothetical protein
VSTDVQEEPEASVSILGDRIQMTEAAGSSETLVSIYQTPRRRIPRDLYEATVFPRRISRFVPVVSIVKYEHSY